jgi:hypothetical protein
VISTVLVMLHAFVPALFAVFVLACVVAGLLLVRAGDRARRALQVLAVLGGVAVLALTLTPSSAEPAPAFCTMQWEPFSPGVTGLANMVLFVPLAYFGGLATRRPLLVVLGAVALSAGVEVVQGAVVPLGRACDTDDLWSNAVGAAAGGVLAALTLLVVPRLRRSAPQAVAGGA